MKIYWNRKIYYSYFLFQTSGDQIKKIMNFLPQNNLQIAVILMNFFKKKIILFPRWKNCDPVFLIFFDTHFPVTKTYRVQYKRISFYTCKYNFTFFKFYLYIY